MMMPGFEVWIVTISFVQRRSSRSFASALTDTGIQVGSDLVVLDQLEA